MTEEQKPNEKIELTKEEFDSMYTIKQDEKKEEETEYIGTYTEPEDDEEVEVVLFGE